MDFGVFTFSRRLNALTMAACLAFGAAYISLTTVLATTRTRWHVPVAFVVDACGGIATLALLLVASVVPTVKLYYRDLGLFCLYSTAVLAFFLTALYVVGEAWAAANSEAVVIFFQVLYAPFPPLHFFIFFNLSYSLSAQHAACYLVGMELPGLVVAFLRIFEPYGSPAFVVPLVLLAIALAALALFLVVFYASPDVYSLLRSQKTLTRLVGAGAGVGPPAWRDCFRLLWRLLREKRASLLAVAMCYLSSKALLPHYLELAPCAGQPNAWSAPLVAFLAALGVVAGRALLFVPKKPGERLVVLASAAFLLFCFPVVLVLFFMTRVGLFPPDPAFYAAMGLAPLLGAADGYLAVCAIDLSLAREEPRVAVAVVSVALYAGVFGGALCAVGLGGIEVLLDTHVGGCV